jgi:diguanylate cyclase (GGDEF)-like protein
LLLTVIAARLGAVRGPVVTSFIPVCATLWCVGDLLTGFLLYAHYRVTGRLAFLAVGCAYIITGLLTLPYLAAFPGVLSTSPHYQQVSIWAWACWHVLFPVTIGVYSLIDGSLSRRLLDERVIQRVGWPVFLFTIGLACALMVAIWFLRLRVPPLIEHGTFTELYKHVVAPGIAAVCLCACAIVLRRWRSMSSLELWIALALFVTALDGTLNAASLVRYSYAWYVGKFETLVMATILLAVLLSEIAVLYESITSLAMYDPLTGLRNRRSFEDAGTWLLNLSHRKAWPVAALMIDIDHFKRFNDVFGHAAGDECLRSVAQALDTTLSRSADVLGRYGGEEFAAVIADLRVEDAAAIAQRLLQAVRECVVPSGAGLEQVTISIGLAWLEPRSQPYTVSELLKRADAALYQSKTEGRDRVTSVGYSQPLFSGWSS